ncbi:MAG: nicotinamide riboside transporter PnuC, partial [Chitinophagaceae bacterium]
GGPGYKYPIRWCTLTERVRGIALCAMSWILLYLILTKLTNSNTPVLDSLVSSSAITAMWWMAKRKIENWHAWIISNIVAIPLNFYKGLMFFTLMYIVFLGMAWMGLMSWKKKVA